jgi:Putative transposase/Transposase zinc-binding domain
MKCSLQDIFARGFEPYARGRKLHPRQWKAASAILRCYTPQAGCHFDVCSAGHASEPIYHACRHRSCPRCADKPRQRWISEELDRLLPCPHFHVIFTLPHELLPLWEHNRQRMASMLFDAVRLSLLQLLGDARHLGATPGILMSLHTWGRTLSHHPHVHALVSAGGLDAKGSWRAGRAGWLLPAEPLKRLFRGKFLADLTEALRQPDGLSLPPRQPRAHWSETIRRLYRVCWNVRINAPYSHGRGVTLYLARYAKGGPVPSARTLLLDERGVHMPYTDHRDHRAKWLHLDTAEFIDRVLWHAPPQGAHTVRHAGLYASAAHRLRRRAALCLGMNWTSPGIDKPLAADIAARPMACPQCQQPLRRVHLRPNYRIGLDEISLSNSAALPIPPDAAAQAMSNWSFKLTPNSRTPRPRGAVVHPAPRGRGIRPSGAA